MRDIIIDLQESYTWKIELTISSSSIFPKEFEAERLMHAKSDNKEFMTYDNANDIFDELFESLLPNYQENLETSLKGSDFVIDSVHFLYFKYHRINFKLIGSYIDSQDWIKKKNTTKNLKSKDDKHFQFVVTVILIY